MGAWGGPVTRMTRSFSIIRLTLASGYPHWGRQQTWWIQPRRWVVEGKIYDACCRIARSRLKWCVFVDSYIGYTVLSTSMDFGMRDRVDVWNTAQPHLESRISNHQQQATLSFWPPAAPSTAAEGAAPVGCILRFDRPVNWICYNLRWNGMKWHEMVWNASSFHFADVPASLGWCLGIWRTIKLRIPRCEWFRMCLRSSVTSSDSTCSMYLSECAGRDFGFHVTPFENWIDERSDSQSKITARFRIIANYVKNKNMFLKIIILTLPQDGLILWYHLIHSNT